jgi:hypothetical protein
MTHRLLPFFEYLSALLVMYVVVYLLLVTFTGVLATVTNTSQTHCFTSQLVTVQTDGR